MKLLLTAIAVVWSSWFLVSCDKAATPVPPAPPEASAKVLSVIGNGAIKITFTEGKCKLPAVSNLPSHAIWEEGGKTYNGCYGFHGMTLVLSYWEDKTVGVIPTNDFLEGLVPGAVEGMQGKPTGVAI